MYRDLVVWDSNKQGGKDNIKGTRFLYTMEIKWVLIVTTLFKVRFYL